MSKEHTLQMPEAVSQESVYFAELCKPAVGAQEAD